MVACPLNLTQTGPRIASNTFDSFINYEKRHGGFMFFSSQLVDILKSDHKKLRAEISLLKETDISPLDRQISFGRFLPLLVSHTQREEKVVYDFMKAMDDENLNLMAFEGMAKHMIADQLVEDMLSENLSEMEWSASAKVLGELVEQHLDEEEREVFPYLKRHLDADTDAALCLRYLHHHHNEDADYDRYQRETLSELPRWS